MNALQEAVLITGATAGIGHEIGQLVAKPGVRLVAVGRRADRLKELEIAWALQGAHVLAIPLDLTAEGSVEYLVETITKHGWWIGTLYNNAGLGKIGSFAKTDWKSHQQMLRLNMEAASHLAHACLPAMLERGKGHLVQISSVAGFTPAPFQATYYATKAYFNSLSMALEQELSGTGIIVTTVCPGPTHSEFQEVAGIVEKGKFPPFMTSEEVARQIVAARGGLLVPGIMNKLVVSLLQLLPIQVRVRILDRLGRRRDKAAKG